MEKSTIKSDPKIKVAIFVAVATILMKTLFSEPKEPAACTIMRDALLSAKKVNYWKLRQDPSVAGEFPTVPMQMIMECGTKSWSMPYPFKFTFQENPLSEEEILELFLKKNKDVHYRRVGEGYTTLFGLTALSANSPLMAPFTKAWEFIKTGKYIMYFDNTWKRVDYEEVISTDVLNTLTANMQFGSMFMSNYPDYRLTAAAHAAPFNSIATQMTKYKDWDFLSPYDVKEHFNVKASGEFVTILPYLMQKNETDILNRVPHYRVRTEPGTGIYFPKFWIHIVWTESGLNVMTNWRQPFAPLEIFFESPHTLKNTLKFVVKAWVKEYILPQFLIDRILKKAHDKLHNEHINDLKTMLHETNLAVH